MVKPNTWWTRLQQWLWQDTAFDEDDIAALGRKLEERKLLTLIELADSSPNYRLAVVDKNNIPSAWGIDEDTYERRRYSMSQYRKVVKMEGE